MFDSVNLFRVLSTSGWELLEIRGAGGQAEFRVRRGQSEKWLDLQSFLAQFQEHLSSRLDSLRRLIPRHARALDEALSLRLQEGGLSRDLFAQVRRAENPGQAVRAAIDEDLRSLRQRTAAAGSDGQTGLIDFVLTGRRSEPPPAAIELFRQRVSRPHGSPLPADAQAWYMSMLAGAAQAWVGSELVRTGWIRDPGAAIVRVHSASAPNHRPVFLRHKLDGARLWRCSVPLGSGHWIMEGIFLLDREPPRWGIFRPRLHLPAMHEARAAIELMLAESEIPACVATLIHASSIAQWREWLDAQPDELVITLLSSAWDALATEQQRKPARERLKKITRPPTGSGAMMQKYHRLASLAGDLTLAQTAMKWSLWGCGLAAANAETLAAWTPWLSLACAPWMEVLLRNTLADPQPHRWLGALQWMVRSAERAEFAGVQLPHSQRLFIGLLPSAPGQRLLGSWNSDRNAFHCGEVLDLEDADSVRLLVNPFNQVYLSILPQGASEPVNRYWDNGRWGPVSGQPSSEFQIVWTLEGRRWVQDARLLREQVARAVFDHLGKPASAWPVGTVLAYLQWLRPAAAEALEKFVAIAPDVGRSSELIAALARALADKAPGPLTDLLKQRPTPDPDLLDAWISLIDSATAS